MSEGPKRAEDVEMVEVADGFVVYHEPRDRVHFINHTAAVVLTLCDGATSETTIATMVQECYELPEPPTGEVEQCLRQFRDEGLID